MIFITLKRALLLATTLTVYLAQTAQAELANAKGLFLEQLESPTGKINTGLKYWILLNEKGKLRSVNNLHLFKSGDKIRFKMLPNINGFAYVAMLEGSSGKSKLLFPLSEKNKGQVLAGKLYTIPEKGYFQFDQKPGLEKLRLVISRQPQSPAKLLEEKEKKIVVIAQSAAPNSLTEEDSIISALGKAEETPLEIEYSNEDSVLDYSKDLNYVPPGVNKARKHRVILHAGKSTSQFAKKRRTGKAQSSLKPVAALIPADSVTLINTNPALDLCAEIELRHIR